jgi:hypothetical protein
MNLTEMCAHLHNWFVRSDADRRVGTFEIVGGSIDLPWLADGQYFRVIGSVFNDGVHQYPAAGLTDESFVGEVWAMAVPSDVVALADEISAWEVKYREAAESPYQSESFGGYAYTKADASEGGLTWEKVFRNRLNRWRKL